MSTLDIAAIDERFEDAGNEVDETREDLIEEAVPLARYLARRVSGKGEPLDDLIQVANIGLVKAVDRFDPDREVRFSTFATPTIVGELKRHFRDRTWALHVPRPIKDRILAIRKATASLTQELGRAPTPEEIAASVGASIDEVAEASDAATTYNVGSLNAALTEDDESRPTVDVAVEEPCYELIERWESIRPHLQMLDDRAKRILYLRFVKDMTQSEIGREIGCSQMHVSRLLNRALDTIREAAGADMVEEITTRRRAS